MKCNHCEKFYNNKTEQRVLHFTHGIIPVQFCCYECYLAFWEDVKRFIPLKAYKPIEKHKRNLRKKQHKHSYDKNAYCF